jgi:dTDP-glucose 4,6-dehydratase
MKKKVLLTGISGFIGSHIAEHLSKNTDWDIVGIASFRHKGDSMRLESLDPSRVTMFYHDLNGPISERLIEAIGPIDYIISCGSESHVDRSITDPVPFVENNVNLILNLLEYSRRVKPEVFIQVSTDEVYGDAPEGVNYKEWSTIRPSNPYSASKACQEAICYAYWRTYNVPLVIVNSMNNFGERQDSEKFMSKCIVKLAAGEKIEIHGDPRTGKIGSRFYLHARNFADAILFLLKNTAPALHGDDCDRPNRYNIVGERELTNLEVAQMIAKIMNKPLDYEIVDFHSSRPGHDMRYALDGTKLANLGWEPPMTTEDSLKKYVEWTLKRKEWLK